MRTRLPPRRLLLGGVLALGGTVAVLLAVRPDAPVDLAEAVGAVPGATVAGVAVPATPPPGTPPTTAPSPGPAAPLYGTWTGPLADPDTVTTRMVLTAGGDPGLVATLPVLGCTYVGAAPAAGAVVDLRADEGSGPTCLDTARVRVTPDPAGGTLRYDVLEGCEGSVCAPRRAGGVLVGSPPGS